MFPSHDQAGGIPTASSNILTGAGGNGDDLVNAADGNIRIQNIDDPGSFATLEIMELRRAQALLRYYEAANRGGHRYVEQLLGIFGVVSDDARLQIPQYLGGGKQNVQISEVFPSHDLSGNCSRGRWRWWSICSRRRCRRFSCWDRAICNWVI